MDIMCELVLYADKFPIDEVYNYIGLEGYKEKFEERQLKIIQGNNIVFSGEYSITYSTGYTKTSKVEKVTKKMIDMITPKKEIIVEVIKKYRLKAKFFIVLNLTDNPEIELSINFIRLSAYLGATIDFDTSIDIPFELVEDNTDNTGDGSLC
jgi:hypothetical protein